MIINGTDYTIYIIAFLSFVFLAGLEYFICFKSKKKSNRQVLLFVPFFILVAALIVYGSESNGGFLDLRGIVSVILVIYALICSIALFAGWFVYKLKYENGKEPPESCPLSEE